MMKSVGKTAIAQQFLTFKSVSLRLSAQKDGEMNHLEKILLKAVKTEKLLRNFVLL